MRIKKEWLVGLVVALIAGAAVISLPTEAASKAGAADVRVNYAICGAYDGTACVSGDTSFRCFNSYPFEPGRCRCGADLLWHCG